MMARSFGRIILAGCLQRAVNGGDVVIRGLHGPDIVPIGTERFSRVCLDARIYEHRLTVVVDDERTDIVMIMTLSIVSAFSS